MNNKRVSRVVAIMFVVLGAILANIVPNFNAIYASMYNNWTDSENILVQGLQVPAYIWFLVFFVIAFVVFILGSLFNAKTLKIFNYFSVILLILCVVHAIDWLYAFTFCHEWGCSGAYLPTWRLFFI